MKLETSMHQCLARGETGYGGWIILNSPLAIEMVGHYLDLDFITVDMQHASVGVNDAAHLLRALQSVAPDVTPLVRTPTQDRYWIEQSLDAGYVGLIVPMVESASQAQALSWAAHYPPIGTRSRGVTVRAGFYCDYFNSINSHVILLPQVETALGLENCNEIVSTPGITGVVLGPGDLNLSCGWNAQDVWTHQDFLEAARRVVSTCDAAGKVAATLVCGLEDARRAASLGFRLIAWVSDGIDMRVDTLPNMQRNLNRLREATPSDQPSLRAV